MEIEEVLSETDASVEVGLSVEEAKKRLLSNGPNSLPERKSHSLFSVFFSQFKSPLIYLLLLAAMGAFFLGKARDAFVIGIVVLVNSIIGAIQEGKAESSMAALRQISSLKARVLRDGKEQFIAARDIVVGDILLLASGDAVSADLRLIDVAQLEIAEAALTGESLPVQKDVKRLGPETLLADRQNMAYAGTLVTSGRATGVVVATGLSTEVGKIAELTQAAEEPKTPLEKRISQFGRYLIYISMVLFFSILALGRLRGIPFTEIFMIGISQIVSMIPEGLPVAVTVALSVGVQRLASQNTIVRRLSAVETLGSTSVICTDKTGTLTRNEMTVTALYLPRGLEVDVTGIGYAPEGELRVTGKRISINEIDGLLELFEAAILCNDAQLSGSIDNKNSWKSVGDPTEVALITLAMKGGLDVRDVREKFPRIGEIPFESETKMMATQHMKQGKPLVFIKGAPEAIFQLCFEKKQMNKEREAILGMERMALHALRVLAFAKVENFTNKNASFEAFKGKAEFLGLVGQYDPPRSEVKAAVAECKNAGIRPVMVTGDHKATGWAIAKNIGIADEASIAVDGAELEKMSDEELKNRLDEIAVFARVHPAQKLRIVEAYQSRNKVVAMTGDGVNDAPALARANVGVAMGITGTEVAKEAAKIVITDDHFATIVRAVEEGRLIYRNIKKLILYLFSTSASEILVLITALFLGYPLPLVAVQILWINLVTDGVVTVTLIMEPFEGDEMRHSPIPLHEPLLTRSLLQRMAIMAPSIAISTLGFFIYQLETGVHFQQARTEAFTVLAVAQWFNVLNCRSEHLSVFQLSLMRNKWLMGGLILGNLLQAAVIYIKPMNQLFHTVPISILEILKIGLVASVVLWVEEIRKYLIRNKVRLPSFD